MSKRPFQLLAAILGLTFLGGAQASAAAPKSPKLVMLAFSADWCGSCKALAPKLKKAMEASKSLPVTYLKYDMTSETTRAASEKAIAKVLKGKVWKSYEGMTGFAAVFAAKDGKELTKFNNAQTPEAIAAKIKDLAGKS